MTQEAQSKKPTTPSEKRSYSRTSLGFVDPVTGESLSSQIKRGKVTALVIDGQRFPVRK